MSHPAAFERAHDLRQIRHRHIDDDRLSGTCQLLPLGRRGPVRRPASRHQDDGMVGLPHGRGNAGQSCSRKPRGDPGNDPEPKPGTHQRQGFLSAAPEHKGIAAFQAQNAPLHPGAFDQKLVDIGLLSRGPAPALARKDQFCLVAREF